MNLLFATFVFCDFKNVFNDRFLNRLIRHSATYKKFGFISQEILDIVLENVLNGIVIKF